MFAKLLQRWLAVVLILALAGLLPACRAKENTGVTTVGVVNLSAELASSLDGFKKGMADLGYTEGKNIRYIYNGAAKNQPELDQIAADFVKQKVDLILAISTPAALAAQRATLESQTPVIFAPVTDAVGAGLAKTLKNPGWNLTGVTNLGSDSRRLELLLDMAPGKIHKIYVPYNSADASARSSLKTTTAAAQKLGVSLAPREATDDAQMSRAVQEIPQDADAIFILPDSLALKYIKELVTISIERKLPLSVPTTTQVEKGALFSYGLNLFSAGQQAARLADQVLRGTDPAILPIEEAEFQFAINLATAQAIGLDIPDSILNQANEIVRK